MLKIINIIDRQFIVRDNAERFSKLKGKRCYVRTFEGVTGATMYSIVQTGSTRGGYMVDVLTEINAELI